MNSKIDSCVIIEGRKHGHVLGAISFILPKQWRLVPCPLKDASYVYNTLTKEFYRVIKTKINKNAKLGRYNVDGFLHAVYIQHDRYIYDRVLDKFVMPPVPNFMKMDIGEIFACNHEIERATSLVIMGLNELHIDFKTTFDIFYDNVFNRLFLINILSISFYIYVDYLYYLTVIYLIMIFSLYFDIKGGVEAQEGLVKMTGRSKSVIVLKNEKWVKCDSVFLVPGDILQVEPMSDFPIDARILSGDCVSDESFLTGECVPINKLTNAVVFSGTKILTSKPGANFEYTMYNNDKLIKVKSLATAKRSMVEKPPKTENLAEETSRGLEKSDYAIAVCISTGFTTTKGKLIKSLLTFFPPDIQFYKEASNIIKKILYLSILPSILCSIYIHKFNNFTLSDSIAYACDLLFVLLTPSLATSILIGASLALDKLKKFGISCFDKERINSAGYVDLCIFDKTGTITEEGLELFGLDDTKNFSNNMDGLPMETIFGLSCCHDTIKIGGKLMGDPLDIILLEFSKANKVEKEIFVELNKKNGAKNDRDKIEDVPNLYGLADLFSKKSQLTLDETVKKDSVITETVVLRILKTFEFESKLRRMSTLVQFGSKKFLFTKGSPEFVKPLLKAIPEFYDETVNEYGMDGFRVIALCFREVDIDSLDRSFLENKLEFCTFVIFANKPKKESRDVILQLKNANIKTMMATGDNILTAISVAKEVGMLDFSMPVLIPKTSEDMQGVSDIEWMCVDTGDYFFDKIKLCLYNKDDKETHLEFAVAMEGNEFDYFRGEVYFHDLIRNKAVIFARMNPEQKKKLVEDMSDNYTTCFCGDGANDCGALKSAEVGISISNGESSVVGTFSSSVKNIRCVTEVIRQGRSALVASISRFKFILSMALVQYIGLFNLVTRKQYLFDFQELHYDIFSVIVVGFFMSRFEASYRLSPFMLDSVIMNEKTMLYLFLSMVSSGVSFYIVSFVLNCNLPVNESSGLITYTKYVTGVFFVMLFNVFVQGALLAEGEPHRENGYKNKWFFYPLLFLVSINVLIFLSTTVENLKIISSVLQLCTLTAHEFLWLSLIIVGNGVFSTVIHTILNLLFKGKKVKERVYE